MNWLLLLSELDIMSKCKNEGNYTMIHVFFTGTMSFKRCCGFMFVCFVIPKHCMKIDALFILL